MTTTDRVHGLRILIVEDEALIAEELQDRLARLGFQVAGVVDTADKAVQSAERERPDLVLMDIRIKGPMDGIEAAGFIRERLKIPIVYLTAHSDQATLARAKETVPFGYVLKPYQEPDLLVAIEMAAHMHMLEQRVRERTVELEETIGKLENALAENRALRGLLPICAWCKKIRDDAGDWQKLETYLRDHFEAKFSHGVCPECTSRQFDSIR